MSERVVVVPPEVVESTIERFTALDQIGDRRTMQKMAQRLGKEQPALLGHAAAVQEEHGATVGEAAVFYATLVWAIFDRGTARRLPRITEDNLRASQEVIDAELAAIADLSERPAHERMSARLARRQPGIVGKLQALIAEDVREDAMTAECAALIVRPTQVILEAFDAALDGRRPGEHQGPVLREVPKVGRNEPCLCGSGKKFKKCCGVAA